MTTRQKNRMRKLLAGALASDKLSPDLAAAVSECLVTGDYTSSISAVSDTDLSYATWRALIWCTPRKVYNPEYIADALSGLHKALKAEGITA